MSYFNVSDYFHDICRSSAELSCDHVILSGLGGVWLDEQSSFSSLQRLFCLVVSRTGRLLCTGGTFGCQEKLREQKDRWPLALKSVLGGSRRHRGASTVLPESREADARTYAFPLK